MNHRVLSASLELPHISLYFVYKEPDVLVFKMVLSNSFPGFLKDLSKQQMFYG